MHGFRFVNGADLLGTPCGAVTGLFGSHRECCDDIVVAGSDLEVSAWAGLLSLPRVVWIWLDSDRGAMSPEPLRLVLPNGAEIVREPQFVDPFESDGCFRPLESVANEILRAPAPPDLTLPIADRPTPDARLQRLIDAVGLEDGARRYVEELRWPDGVTCPRCESDRIGWLEARKKHYCRGCKYQFRVSAGTVFHDSHRPLTAWLLAAQLILESERGFPANQLHAIIGGSYKTSWFVGHRIRSAMSRSLLNLGMPVALALAVEKAETDTAPTGNLEPSDAATEGWTFVKRQIAGAYHRPSAEHLTAYWNEARWRAENIGNENAFRETIQTLIATEPLPRDRLVQPIRKS